MKKQYWLNFFYLPLLVVTILVIFDQYTKYVIIQNITLNGERIEVVSGFFDIVHVKNPGAAWGMFGDHTWALSLLSLFASIGMIAFFKKLSEGFVSQAIAMSLLIGGTIGNLIDRALLSEVTDFLSFHWQTSYYFPAFNVADSAICIGVFMYFVCSIIPCQDKNTPE